MLALATLLSLLAVSLPLVEKRLFDEAIVPGRLEALPPIAALFGAVWLAMTVAGVLLNLLRAYGTERMQLELRRQLFSQSQSLSVAFSRREHSGRTMSLFLNDAPVISGLVSWNVVDIVTSATGLVVGAAVMLTLSWQLALLVAIVPPLVMAAGAVVTQPLRPLARAAQDKAAELSERLQENLAGIREVVAFGRQSSQSARFAQSLRDLLRLRMRATAVHTAIGTGHTVFSLAVTLVILGFGGYLVIVGDATIGTLVAMQSLSGMVFHPAGEIVGHLAGVQKALGAADRIYAFLDERPPVRERPGAAAPGRVAGAMEFERVSFAYRPGEPVLREVSFAARPGEVIALVGPSGAGKTTLASLIARFYDPTSGRILLDARDVRDLTLAGLRDNIAIVFQDTFLFATTIRENVAFGREGACEEEILAAARAANALEFIERLPQGLDTPVGERGLLLSEGQRQRVAIARALLRDPRILILDEPTSALDARSEHLLQAALENLMRGRTTFVIAHRLGTVRRADRILVLERGRLVEQGSHEELLSRGGLYREFFELQFGRAAPHAVRPGLRAAAAGGH